MKKPYRLIPALTLIALASLASGCSQDRPTADDPAPGTPEQSAPASGTLESLIADGLREAGSDFQRELLEQVRKTGELSEADWKEANNRYVACMAEHGRTIELVYQGATVLEREQADQGGLTDHEAAQDERIKTEQECMMKTKAFINEVYAYLHGETNPGNSVDGETVERKILACLIERGLVPEDSTYEQFINDLNTNEGREFGGGSSEEAGACWRDNT